MKLIVVGLGQAGSRIADEFAKINKRAKSQRNIEICPGIFAVNTDAADLTGLTTIEPDYQHRILIGGRKTGGHGVGKINELGAEVARADADKVIDALRTARHFYEADAFLLAASSAGGTGSGSIPVIAQRIKERYPEKPLYSLLALPFEHERETEERASYNSAVCLKSVYSISDCVFLIDNQRYVMKDSSLGNNISRINEMIVEPFYDLLCAGEEKNPRFIGAKTLDAGDIIQTMSGWSVYGWGHADLTKSFNLFEKSNDFRKKGSDTHKGIQAMDEAISEMSLRVNPKDAGRAIYLVSAPAKEMNMDMMRELNEWMREMCPNAIIRNGDYPRGANRISVTVILSELSDVEKVRNFYSDSIELIPVIKQRQTELRAKLGDIDDMSRDIPSLLE